MMRQRVEAALRTWRGSTTAVLVVLLALVGGGYAVARQRMAMPETTSLEIIAWSQVAVIQQAGPPRMTEKKVFDKTITDQRLVHDIQETLDGSPRGVAGDCWLPMMTYNYELRFATQGVTTEVYTGYLNCTEWNVTTHGVTNGVGLEEAGLDGVDMMEALHKLTGMPVTSTWDVPTPTPVTGS